MSVYVLSCDVAAAYWRLHREWSYHWCCRLNVRMSSALVRRLSLLLLFLLLPPLPVSSSPSRWCFILKCWMKSPLLAWALSLSHRSVWPLLGFPSSCHGGIAGWCVVWWGRSHFTPADSNTELLTPPGGQERGWLQLPDCGLSSWSAVQCSAVATLMGGGSVVFVDTLASCLLNIFQEETAHWTVFLCGMTIWNQKIFVCQALKHQFTGVKLKSSSRPVYGKDS